MPAVIRLFAAWLQQRLHPFSGAAILALDWIFFSSSLFSGFLLMPLAIVLGFLAGTIGVYTIQRRYHHDPRGTALIKGLASGVVVGLPFPIGGTLFGGLILAASGLQAMKEARQAEGGPVTIDPPRDQNYSTPRRSK